MIKDDEIFLLKPILCEMDNELPLEDFCLILEKETNGKITFSNLKELIDKNYSNINKSDKITLLKKISVNSSTGMISILKLFNHFSKIINKKINSPILSFYSVADTLEHELKISTLEFIYGSGLLLDSEINIDQFNQSLCKNLKLAVDDSFIYIIFKGLDYKNIGRIRVEDFVLVVDSYRDDFLSNLSLPTQTTSLDEVQNFKLLMDQQFLTVGELFKKIDLRNLNYAEYETLLTLLKTELKESNEILIKNILNKLKREGNKIFIEDFENLVSVKITKITTSNLNLNDIHLYWVNKYISTLESINLTEKMAYDTAKDSKTNCLYLDNLKRKLKLLLPVGRLSTMDLNTMIEALDVYKKRSLTWKEYDEIMGIIRNSNKLRAEDAPNIRDNNSNINNINRSLTNTWVRGTKSVNFHLLPVKGNSKVLINLQKIISINNNKLVNESPSVDLTKTHSHVNREKNNTNTRKPDDTGISVSVNNFTQDTFEDYHEVFEDFTINTPMVPSYNLFVYLQDKVENYSRSKFYLILKKIDKNKDGYISYNDIIVYLLNEHKHRSTKLAFKYMSSRIHNELKVPSMEFFSSQGINVETELNINNISELLGRIFNFEHPISKKIYDEMKIIYSPQKTILTINELIDLIDEFKIDKYQNESTQYNKDNTNQIIDMREFEENIKQFVMNFVDDGDNYEINTRGGFNISCKQKLNQFRENFKHAVNLPSQMNLQQFKDFFIKPLRMDMNLGLTVFQLLKNFTLKNEQIVSKEDLGILLESYIEDQIDGISKFNSAIHDINSEITELVKFIESSGCYLRYAFDSLPYATNSSISCVNFVMHMSQFYPKIDKKNFYKFLQELDESRTGHIKYENLQNFLHEHSKGDKFSIALELKKIASELESKHENKSKPALEYFSSLNITINNYSSVKKNEHILITDKLCSNKQLKEELFNFLCEKSHNLNGYDITLLCEMIDYYREFVDNNDILNQIIINEKDEVLEAEVIDEINSHLKPNLTFDSFLDGLNFGEAGEISIYEIFKKISSFNLDKTKIVFFLKSIDEKRNGFISYHILHNKLKDFFLDNYIGSLVLNARNLFNTIILPEYSGDIKNFILSKANSKDVNLMLSKDNFSFIFLEFFFNDILLFNTFFIKYRDTKSKNMIRLQKFFDFISSNCKDYLFKYTSSNPTTFTRAIDEELENEVFNIFNDIEGRASSTPIKFIFDNFSSVNSIQTEGSCLNGEVRRILIEKFSLSEETAEKVIRMFSIGLDTFDLVKLVDYILLNCEKSFTSINAISTKMKNNLIKFNISQYDQFLRKFSLNKNSKLNIKNLVVCFTAIFKLSIFECFVLNSDCQLYLNEKLEINFSIDFIFNHYNLTQVFKTKSDIDEEKTKFSLTKDCILKLAIRKLSDYIDEEKDKAKFFKKFDLNNDGNLSTQEFMKVLNSIKDLDMNDAQKVSLIKVADKNKDGNVNYKEFLEFLKLMKTELDTDTNITSKNSNLFLMAPTKLVQKIEFDFKKLKINYEMNSRIVDSKSKDKLTNYLFILQEDFYTNFDKYENLEHDFNVADESNSNSYNIDRSKFLLVLKKRLLKIDSQTMDDLVKFANQVGEIKERNQNIDEIKVNYKNFLINLINFRIVVKNIPPACPTKIKQDADSSQNNDNNKLNHSKKVTRTKKTLTATLKNKKAETVKLVDIAEDYEYSDNKFEENDTLDLESQIIKTTVKNDIKTQPKTNQKSKKRVPTKIKNRNEQEDDFVNKAIDSSLCEETELIAENITKKSAIPKKKFTTSNIENSTNSNNNASYNSDKNYHTSSKIEIEITSLKSEAIEKMTELFCHKSITEANETKSKSNTDNFYNFISKLNNLNYKGYDYQIVPEKDYFQRMDNGDNQLIPTILNSEDAAIKKCEEIYSSLQENELFYDKDFGDQSNDNGEMNRRSLYISGNPPKGGLDPKIIQWSRMSDISRESTPVFFDDGVESNDVMQGALGDCWFISAISILATKDHLLRGEFNESILEDGTIDDEEAIMLSTGVYPPIFHAFRRKNIFCFRFFKNFKWRYVIIDDRLPCKKCFNDVQVPKLIYGKCRNESEFWVPLLEKAYAKLHGSYESLISGFIDDGLVDMTSFSSRKYIISPDEKKISSKSDSLWEMLKLNTDNNFSDVNTCGQNLYRAKVFTKNGTMMGCSVEAKVTESEVIYLNKKCGILAGHAYAILDVIEIPKPLGKKRKFSRLIRIRNPWGFKEWNGKWSDESEELSKSGIREHIELVLKNRYKDSNEKISLDQEDGTFFMCFHDFRNVFSKLFICMDFSPSVVGIRYYDEWNKEQSGGLPINNTSQELLAFAKNPQYYMSLKFDSFVNISLMQADGRLSKSKFPYPDYTKKACLIIAKTKGKNKMKTFDNDLIVEITPIRQHREISFAKNLPAGEYLIIPSVLKEGELGKFCLEVYFNDIIKGKVKLDVLKINMNDKLTNTILEKLENSGNSKCEIICDQVVQIKEIKKNFILSQFLNILKHSDNVKYDDNCNANNINRKNYHKNKNKNDEENWDEY